MISHFFIRRPIFAVVLSTLVVLAGGIFVWTLPIAQYPEITPPSVQVSARYAGASGDIVAETVATPIEQQVVGVERMLYMSSQSANDGSYQLVVTFEVGTDLDMAQVLVQNRVNLALPVLPQEVTSTGVSVKKASPSALLAINLYSPDESRDQLYLSNYTTIRLKDELAKIDGVGDLLIGGQRDYSMRIWLDPHLMATLELTATDVIAALREQNIQVAAGALGQPPVPQGESFQYTLTTKGRLLTEKEFGGITIRTGSDGQLVKIEDVVSEKRQFEGGGWIGGIQYGAAFETTDAKLDGVPSAGTLVFQRPGSNALGTAQKVRKRMEELRELFPPGVDYAIVYDTTPFIGESVNEVFKSLRDAIILVAIVVLVFLQSWRAALVPLVAVPVAIIGTFAVMAGIGYSLNNLSLFGLVLAIGIVVDDAIVVVEAIEHKIEHGAEPVQACHDAMDEVTAPIIGISTVLMCVFVPCMFISGITGMFFQQFAVTIAVSTFFSAVNSLSLSPALSALLLKPKEEQTDFLSRLISFLLGWFFKLFNAFFSLVTGWYRGIVGWLLRLSLVVLVVYAALLYLTYDRMTNTPKGFVPSQDKGYLLIDVQLPDSASLERTSRVCAEINQLLLGERNGHFIPDEEGEGDGESEHESSLSMVIPGVTHTMTAVGQSFIQQTIAPNYATLFVVLDAFERRHGPSMRGPAIAQRIRELLAENVIEARTLVLGAPAIDGLGTGGGFKVMIRDIGQMGFADLQATVDQFSETGAQQPEIMAMMNGFSADTPQMYVDVDRDKCKQMHVPLSEVFTGLQAYLGSYYVNDFNAFGRTWQVNIQADPKFRLRAGDVGQIYVRNEMGQMVPLSAVAKVEPSEGPVQVLRYNGFPAVGINGVNTPGVSTGDVIARVDEMTATDLPFGFDAQWTEITLLQILAGNTAMIVFGLSVVLVYLVLAAQYESLRLPFAVILVVPMCLLSSVLGVTLWNMDINIFVQIGFVVLVGLASKNAILIVEFAKEQQADGMNRFDATLEACRLRLRPIIMTSLAFILGVVPLVVGTGAGAEMRQALGVAVFCGMLGVTFFGVFLTPVFYYLIADRDKPDSSNPKIADPAVVSDDPSSDGDSASDDDESDEAFEDDDDDSEIDSAGDKETS